MNPFGPTDEEFEDMLNEPENLQVDESDSETEPCLEQNAFVPQWTAFHLPGPRHRPTAFRKAPHSLAPHSLVRSTVSLDGSEDDMIHCFKQHGPVPEGREMLREARIANAEIDLTNDPEEDPDENHENGSLSFEPLDDIE
ncbi:putative neuronal acetylcholine receptor subunit alpha-7-like [Ditylenchus destructor]|uniref:Neuronal acetylcholine receptor subunit alpha-7-like n=1 Tax=Ditylenchus destructor TaxID=166010 RepID=A0AAD4MPK6_9BILA|nr:putative neuronal acetylcholine receptor subunit alpha-7-like [Ditylenchus destructor]